MAGASPHSLWIPLELWLIHTARDRDWDRDRDQDGHNRKQWFPFSVLVLCSVYRHSIIRNPLFPCPCPGPGPMQCEWAIKPAKNCLLCVSKCQMVWSKIYLHIFYFLYHIWSNFPHDAASVDIQVVIIYMKKILCQVRYNSKSPDFLMSSWK